MVYDDLSRIYCAFLDILIQLNRFMVKHEPIIQYFYNSTVYLHDTTYFLKVFFILKILN